MLQTTSAHLWKTRIVNSFMSGIQFKYRQTAMYFYGQIWITIGEPTLAQFGPRTFGAFVASASYVRSIMQKGNTQKTLRKKKPAKDAIIKLSNQTGPTRNRRGSRAKHCHLHCHLYSKMDMSLHGRDIANSYRWTRLLTAVSKQDLCPF